MDATRFLCQSQCKVCIHYDFSSYLRDGFVYDAALLNAVGGGYATTEYTGDTLYAIVVCLLYTSDAADEL